MATRSHFCFLRLISITPHSISFGVLNWVDRCPLPVVQRITQCTVQIVIKAWNLAYWDSLPRWKRWEMDSFWKLSLSPIFRRGFSCPVPLRRYNVYLSPRNTLTRNFVDIDNFVYWTRLRFEKFSNMPSYIFLDGGTSVQSPFTDFFTLSWFSIFQL